MKYVDAGYAVALGVLALYAVALVLRRRRLERASAVAGAWPEGDGPVRATEAQPDHATALRAAAPSAREAAGPAAAPRGAGGPAAGDGP